MTKPRVARGSLADVAFDSLLELIMEGTLAPGEPLKLAQLAETLGISQTPIRESLARLEAQGLVVREPMRGFAVAEQLTVEQYDMLMAARLILEPEIAADAAEHRSEEIAEALVRNVAASQSLEIGTTFEGYRGYLELSAQFHDLISEACRNRFLCDALAFLPVHVQRFRLFGSGGVTDRDVSLAEHRRVLEAIVAKDPVAAREAMVHHVKGVHSRSRSELNAAV